MQKLHIISHTHWDREWYLTFQQFRLKLVHLIDNLLDILEQDPDFRYFMLDGQTIMLDDFLQMRPEKEEMLRKHVQNGRILIGPWHILPDMFLVSPEAHIRNLLEGARTARKFGLKMPIGYIPDPFGYPGQIPQILKGFGIEAAVLWRGVGDMPTELWWESPDGSKVLLAYLRDSYSNGASLPVNDPDQFADQLSIAANSLAAHSAFQDYLIMLGTDHMEPSPNTSVAIADANHRLRNSQVIHSTLPDYVQSIVSQMSDQNINLPTIRGELRACDHAHLLPGVLSTRMWIKQRNHRNQTLLEKWAEPFSVFSETIISENQGEKIGTRPSASTYESNRVRNVAPIIRQAWRLVMENHPHDSICGCSIDQVHDEMKQRFDQAHQIAEEITCQSLEALSAAADTQSDEVFSAMVIFNPMGSIHRDLVEVGLNIPEGITGFEIVDEKKNVIQYEFVHTGNEEIANVLIKKDSIRDTVGAINEGRAAGFSIIQVKTSRDGEIVTIDAVLDRKSQPNMIEWHQAEAEIAGYETDPTVTHFHVIARTQQTSRIRFISPAVPAFGWRTIWLRALVVHKTAPPVHVSRLLKPILPLALRIVQSQLGEIILSKITSGDETKPPFRIENEYFVVEANRINGTLAITDKRTGVVYSGLNRFVDGGDAGDEYNYSPPQKDSFYTSKVESLKVFRHRLIQSIEITQELKIPSRLTTDRTSRSKNTVTIPILCRISLAPGVDRIDIYTEIDNLAADHRLRVHFPAPFLVEEADYDGHFEVVRRQLGVPEKGEHWAEDPRPEVPQRAFTDISNGTVGLMIANKGLPEVEVIKMAEEKRTEIALTLLRCVGWLSRDDMPVREGHAGPAYETPGGQVPGRWAFEYAIIPHQGGWSKAFHQAYACETHLRVIETGIHNGIIPTQGTFISHTPAEFVISAVKEAENGKGWIVRGYNITAEKIRLNLKPLGRFTQAMRVNLAEEEISSVHLGEGGNIEVIVSGHEIVSILFYCLDN
jgi:mannosylglycerate hydrolase